MPTRTAILLELATAADPFLHPGMATTRGRRERLRSALREALTAEEIETPEEALDALRRVIRRCVELQVQWAEVAAIVNRESVEPYDART